MDINKIIQNNKDFISLLAEIQNKKLPTSILLISKDSLYVGEFAKNLASAILNEDIIENENHIKVMLGSHPDVKIYPQKEKLLVGDSEDIVMESFVKPIFANKKIFIIKNIDNSMEQAQNKLLKILEEPPKDVFFILTCSSIDLVLPTIRSRCNKTELSKLPQKIIEDIISDNSNAKLISTICDGEIGKAIQISKAGNIKEVFSLALSVLCKMKSSKVVLNFSKKILNLKEDFNIFLEIFCLLLEDLLYIKSGNNVRFDEYKNELMSIEKEYSIKAICYIQQLIDESMKKLGYNGNITLITENLLMDILEVKYICK